MSRQTKRAYLELCPEKQRKKEFMHLRVKKIIEEIFYNCRAYIYESVDDGRLS